MSKIDISTLPLVRVYDGETAEGRQCYVAVGEPYIFYDEKGFEYCRFERDALFIKSVHENLCTLKVRDSHIYFEAACSSTDLSALLALDERVTSKRPRTLATLIVVLFVSVGGLYVVSPYIADMLANRIPISWEERLASSFLEEIEAYRCEDESLLQTMFLALQDYEDVKYTKEPWLVHSPIVNAFALPGGQIVVTSAFLNFTEEPLELLGVMAHEIEHVERRHISRQLVRDTILTSIWTIAIGDYSGAMVLDPATLNHVVNLSYSRAFEEEADAGTKRRFHDLGYDTGPVANLFERLDDSDGDAPDILSTHPASEKRSAYFASIGGQKPEIIPQSLWERRDDLCGRHTPRWLMIPEWAKDRREDLEKLFDAGILDE